MEAKDKPTNDAAKNVNPKNRDFQRVSGDTDRVSRSEKEAGDANEQLKHVNPEDRDFQRKDGKGESTSEP